MKAIMVMFDSLNRNMLPSYGCKWIHAPNFQRLAQNSVTFENCYAGSLPCIPARRELHSGRYNFLHRSWGPLEAFDDSMPEILKRNNIYSHLISDHYHYWEDGGCTYHTRYNSWEIVRGQEGDQWKGIAGEIEVPDHIAGRDHLPMGRYNWINRMYREKQNKHPQENTFDLGIDFITKNRGADNWFLHIETFDPHEPFESPQHYKELYPHKYNGPIYDWPEYGEISATDEEKEHVRYEYASLVSMCDAQLGRVLDIMDHFSLWEDTMLIVNTDHGFLLGEHNTWAKMVQPVYNEISRIPLFVWDPRINKKQTRNHTLVQTIDLAPTVLDYFNIDVPSDMQGRSLKTAVEREGPIRAGALFGIHGMHVNCTDGRYVYMRSCAHESNEPLYEYTLFPTHVRGPFRTEELQTMELHEPFSFTKGCRLMKIKSLDWYNHYAEPYSNEEFEAIKKNPHHIRLNPEKLGTLLFDLKSDPRQMKPIHDADIENKMIQLMKDLMENSDAPVEQYERLGLQ